MAEIVSLAEAIADAVHDGDTVAMEGFTHLIPHAAGREVIRQRRRDLTLVRMTPDVIYDQMIGAGCARKLVFSWGGNPGVGSLHRFRDAVEHSWPVPLEIEEHSHAGMANRYLAGASGLPFAILRGYSGTGLADHAANVAEITCPFTGDTLTAVAALRPDVTVIPQNCTLPARSARCAWITVTSGRRAATAVSVSPVNGQVISAMFAAWSASPVPLYPRSTANGSPDAPAT